MVTTILKRCLSASTNKTTRITTSKFVQTATRICTNDSTWQYITRPDIDPNTIMYQTFYGNSCILTSINYNNLHSKHSQSSISSTNINCSAKNTNCVISILNDKITEINQLFNTKSLLIGGINETIKDYIFNESSFDTRNTKYNITHQFVLYQENMSKFEQQINIERLKKMINFDFQDRITHSNSN